jgi:dihydrofolate reductase
MGRLVHSTNISLDGCITDTDGRFDWSVPDRTVHMAINDLVRPMRTHLYGRRLYDVMAVWETFDDDAPESRDFAQVWRGTDKIVYSRTLEQPTTSRTRVEDDFDPATVRAFVDASETDVLIGGAELTGQALAAGIVDDLHAFVSPVVLGGGTRWLPEGVHLDLELVAEDRFASGVVHLHHRVVR